MKRWRPNHHHHPITPPLLTITALTLLCSGTLVTCSVINNNVYSETPFISSSDSVSLSVIPHDIHPGYSVKKFTKNTTENLNFHLVETGFSEFFTVLENGLLMTTSDVSPLINQPINLIVLEETPNITSSHALQVYVLDRRNMLRFRNSEENMNGHVLENMPPGTRVKGLTLIQATTLGKRTSPVIYSIVEGNWNDAFTLQNSLTGAIHPIIHIDERNEGVYLVTAKTLDREDINNYTLTLQASDITGVNKALIKMQVEIDDDNDHSPIFTEKVYRFIIGDPENIEGDNSTLNKWKRFAAVGKVEAHDADGDNVVYKLLVPSNIIVIVPQTGELLLTGDPPQNLEHDIEVELLVEAHDLRNPSRISKQPAQVLFQLIAPPKPVELDEALQELEERELHRGKRRVTRAVRPTKRVDFTEADGDTEGRNVFQLEKETDRETFKIRDENPWVTVEPNGAVRVKKKWDYEELGPEKTIDFWVTITNAGNAGKCRSYVIYYRGYT